MYKATFRDGRGILQEQLIDMSPYIPILTSQTEIWSECGKYAALLALDRKFELIKIEKQ